MRGVATAAPPVAVRRAGLVVLVALGSSVYDAAATAWTSLDAPYTLRREGMAAVWAGDELFTFGGAARTDASDVPVYGDAWLWTAPGQG